MQQDMNAESPEKQFLPKPAGRSRVNHRKPWTFPLAIVGLSLLVILPMGYTAFDFFLPKAPSQGQISSTRAGWYLNSGQWRADFRTFVSAIEFVMDLSPDATVGPNIPTNQLAAPSRPVDTNPPAPNQVKGGDLGFYNARG